MIHLIQYIFITNIKNDIPVVTGVVGAAVVVGGAVVVATLFKNE